MLLKKDEQVILNFTIIGAGDEKSIGRHEFRKALESLQSNNSELNQLHGFHVYLRSKQVNIEAIGDHSLLVNFMRRNKISDTGILLINNRNKTVARAINFVGLVRGNQVTAKQFCNFKYEEK